MLLFHSSCTVVGYCFCLKDLRNFQRVATWILKFNTSIRETAFHYTMGFLHILIQTPKGLPTIYTQRILMYYCQPQLMVAKGNHTGLWLWCDMPNEIKSQIYPLGQVPPSTTKIHYLSTPPPNPNGVYLVVSKFSLVAYRLPAHQAKNVPRKRKFLASGFRRGTALTLLAVNAARFYIPNPKQQQHSHQIHHTLFKTSSSIKYLR